MIVLGSLGPALLPTGREVLFAWGGGLYLLDLDSRRVGCVVSGALRRSGGACALIQSAFVSDEPS